VSWPTALLFGVAGWGGTIVGGFLAFLLLFLMPESLGARLWYDWKLLRPQKLLGRCDMPRGSPRTGIAGQRACLEVAVDRSFSSREDAEAARALCHDAWSENACDRMGVVGGCRVTAGLTFWYYGSDTLHSWEDVTCDDPLEVVRP
jgi:hypothetical protein